MDNFEKIVIEQKKQNILVSGLLSKYKLGKSSVYGKLDALGIEPIKEGKTSYITPEDLQLLDDLQAYLNNPNNPKANTKDFVQKCIESGRIDPSSIKPKKKRKSAAPQIAELPPEESSEIVVATQQMETVVTSSELPPQKNREELRFAEPPLQVLAQLEAQKQQKISQEDLAEANERSQYRAATKVVAEDVLARMYEVTEQFTVPGLKEQVDEQRRKLKESRSNQGFVNAGNDFLSQMFQSQMPPPGTIGSTK